LTPNQLRRTEKLYTRRIPPQQVVTPEFARQLSELSHETRRQIGVVTLRDLGLSCGPGLDGRLD
jgi:GTP-binding protein HflX